MARCTRIAVTDNGWGIAVGSGLWLHQPSERHGSVADEGLFVCVPSAYVLQSMMNANVRQIVCSYQCFSTK